MAEVGHFDLKNFKFFSTRMGARDTSRPHPRRFKGMGSTYG